MPAISVFMHTRRSAETDDDWERVISGCRAYLRVGGELNQIFYLNVIISDR